MRLDAECETASAAALQIGEGVQEQRAARGWHPFRGTTSALTPEGVVRTPDEDDGVFLLPCSATIDLDGALTCDWRDGDVW